MVAKSLSELAWQTQIVNLAKALRFLSYHTLDARGSERGFPDLVLQKAPRLILMELKRQASSAVLTMDQVAWLDDAARTRNSGNPGVEVYGAVRPLDSPALQVTLIDGPQAPGALHQWCLSPRCARCTRERDRAKVVLPTRRRPGRRR